MTIPTSLTRIIEDFQLCEGREKVDLVVKYSEQMPELPERLANRRETFEQVEECMTPVFVTAELQGNGLLFFFDVPAESPTVRGFSAMLAEGLNGSTPEQVLAVPHDFYQQMGLDKVLSNQRLNGISAILAHMKRLAAGNLSSKAS